MCDLVVTENGSVVGTEKGRIYVKLHDEELTTFPSESLESITLMSNSTVTAYLIKQCLTKNIPILYITQNGKYLGGYRGVTTSKTSLQRAQCELFNTEFSLNFAKKIVTSKIKNQISLLYRHKSCDDVSTDIESMNNLKKRILFCDSIDAVRGYEGRAAAIYFKGLSRLSVEFAFDCRSRRPPLDPFNSMLCFGYSILYNLFYSLIEAKGLNPFFGFFHADGDRHASLASDLMEEWRPLIVDSSVLSLIRKKMILKEQFNKDEDGGVYLNKDAIKKFRAYLQNKLFQKNHTVESVEEKKSYFDFISHQVSTLIRAILRKDFSLFECTGVKA
ncbi:MAG: CRISPR-associated endonuclease Cas1 [Succinivibrio dextrinosolvens]|nr:CRISPR-associated endonuclease Cas1 [Succinivibrio dextrinosolvens]